MRSVFKKKKKKKWRFFWKNIGCLGRLNRLVAGAGLIAAAYMAKDEEEGIALLLAGWGAAFIFDGLMRWSVWRAIFRRPSKSAYRKRYPEEA